jgi:rhodanese-related sulfurtransferase
LQDDIFEASHTYKIKGSDKYLTVIEAQNGPAWRYYKVYLADSLDGEWHPLATSKDKNFAGKNNVKFPADNAWADSISHVELLRSGFDENMEIDPNNMKLLYQGVLDSDTSGKPYGQIPWRLGVLEWNMEIPKMEYRKLSANEAKKMIDEVADVMILDVRTNEEFQENRIPNAVLLPDDEVGEKAADVLPDKDALILIYCRSGRRSANAARELTAMGYTNVYDFGGIIDWPYDTEKK